MSKTYTFQEPYYTIEVPITTVVCGVAVVWCVWRAIVGGGFLTPPLYLMFAVAGVYQVWNVCVSHAYPHHVVVDDESVSFCTKGGHADRYELAEVSAISVRGNARNGRMFIRMNEPTLQRGRYWIGSQDFSDGRELFDWFIDLECTVHPDGLRARSMGRGDFAEK